MGSALARYRNTGAGKRGYSAQEGVTVQKQKMALAHTVGSKSSRSYARSDLLAERAKLMEMWGAFCGSQPVETADVLPMRKAQQ
jgi:hypothetical protein